MVEACIYDDGDNCCEEDSGREDNKRKGPVLISIILSSYGNENSHLRKKWGSKRMQGKMR